MRQHLPAELLLRLSNFNSKTTDQKYEKKGSLALCD